MKCTTELEEQEMITAWRCLAKAALVNRDAERRLLHILEDRVGALGSFEESLGNEIYLLPSHLRYGPFYEQRKSV